MYDNGDLVLHDVTSLDRLPNDGSLDHRLGRHVKPSQVVKQPSDNIILPQTTDNVKVSGQIEGYYKKCGDDFYEKMPTKNIAQAAFDVLTGSDTLVLPGSSDNNILKTQ